MYIVDAQLKNIILYINHNVLLFNHRVKGVKEILE